MPGGTGTYDRNGRQLVNAIIGALDVDLSTRASEATAQEILAAVGGATIDDKYYCITATISADTTYTPPFTGSDLIFYSSKALVVRLNNVANDPIPLAARIGIKLNSFQITSVILTSVPVNTDIQLIVTGQ